MSIALGSKVFLKACRTGKPGIIIRAERGKFTVYWADLDHWSRHAPESLELAEGDQQQTVAESEEKS